MEAAPGLARLDVVDACVDLRVEVAEALGHGLDALVGLAGGGEEPLALGDVAVAHGIGELGRLRRERADLGLDVPVVAGGGGVELRVARRSRRPGHDQRARRVARRRAADAVLPGLEVEREAARQPVRQILALAQDQRAVEDLELGQVRALVDDLERLRAGGGLQRLRAAVAGERDGDLAAVALVVAAAAGCKRRRDGEGREAEEDGAAHVGRALAVAGTRRRQRSGQRT